MPHASQRLRVRVAPELLPLLPRPAWLTRIVGVSDYHEPTQAAEADWRLECLSMICTSLSSDEDAVEVAESKSSARL